MWKHPDDVKLSKIQRLSIWYELLEEKFDDIDKDAMCVCLLVGVTFFVQCIWYFVLRHNSSANSASLMAAIGCVASAFWLGLLTILAICMGIFIIDQADEKIRESQGYAEYCRRAEAKRKQLFDKIDKDLLGEDEEL